MNKGLKIGLIAGAGLLGVLFLASCTASFCDTIDQAHLLYSYDPGVTKYSAEMVEDSEPLQIFDSTANRTYTIEGVYCTYSYDNSTAIKTAMQKATTSGIALPTAYTFDYYKRLDNNALCLFLKQKLVDENRGGDLSVVTADDILNCTTRNIDNSMYHGPVKQIGLYYGDLKFVTTKSDSKLWDGYDALAASTKEQIVKEKEDEGKQGLDFVPSSDFIKVYKDTMNGYTNAFRTCLATNTGFYGSYASDEQILIHSKTVNYGWSRGFFEGLLVWPIGAFIDILAINFGAVSISNGVPQILAIFVITIVIRSIMLLITFKSTLGNAKMTELQPEIAKIQNKYPNSNTNNYEKQRMAEEMQKLYKKNRINPFSSIIVMVVQFPVFICVWGALSGSSILTSGTICGLKLSSSISSVLFVASNWTAAGNYCAVTAFVLFLLMAGAQAVSTLLPQWIQKRKQKDVAKLGKNPAQNSQSNKMKWFTYIMLAVIIFMGFSLVSAMGVYWLCGAIFSVAQTFLMQFVMYLRAKKKGAN